MNSLEFSTIYKNKIINLLLKNKNFIQLINPTPNECEDIDTIDILLGGDWIIDGKKYHEQGYIFDYDFTDDTTDEEKTFVMVETDIEFVHKNTFVDFNLYVCIFTSKKLVRINEFTSPNIQQVKEMGYVVGNRANRIDILCNIVNKILNGNNNFPGIGSISPVDRGYVTLYQPNNKYYGKCLKYNITDRKSTRLNSSH